ncbi:hypothetical protein [Nocardioides sp. URHA0020]|uniref:hypothetical protein n=1 Tax=Nocardioides sp. URHA0020 TaxID=1380392 RepID=UPI000490D7E5|nr:hypothetical protein [Nocardioides sp. URHA0020]
MTRVRVALLMGTVAVLAVLATAALAVTTYVADDRAPAAPAARPLVVRDPATGARFEVPGRLWEVRGERSRIYLADDSGRPTAVVTGPAVYRDGYCEEQPGDSNRGFAGFTDGSFDAWRASLGGSGEAHRGRIDLADGSAASLRWVLAPGGTGPCAAARVELAMVSAGDVRVVLVADAGEGDTLAHADIVRVLSSLRR